MKSRFVFVKADDERGVALLITLAVMAVILAVTFELNRQVHLKLDGAVADRIHKELIQVAREGLEIGHSVLISDAGASVVDSVQEQWADPEYMAELLNGLGYDSEKLIVTITDELGKIQVNALIQQFPGHHINSEQRLLWNRFLGLVIGADHSDDGRNADEMINSLVDFIDSGDDDMITGVSGAESDYYGGLDVPYCTADQPFYDLNQIYRVKGFSPDFLTLAPNRKDYFESVLGQETDLEAQSLITVYGILTGTGKRPGKNGCVYPGKININTAPLPVIASLLPFGKQDLAREIHAYRKEKAEGSDNYTHNLALKGWYAAVAGLGDTEQEVLEKQIIYGSHVFSIKACATQGHQQVCLTQVVVRERDKTGQWGCRILKQHME